MKVGGQWAALATLRWQLFRNALRGDRERWELAAKVAVFLPLAALAVVVAVGCGLLAYFALHLRHPGWFMILYWVAWIGWIVGSIFLARGAPETRLLLRFPLRFPVFYGLSLANGIFSPVAAFVLAALACAACGVLVARPAQAAVSVPAVALFAAFALLFDRALFSWIERWLASRRGRTVLAALLIAGSFAYELLLWRGPSSGIGWHPSRALLAVVAWLPPSLAAHAIAHAGSHTAEALDELLGLAGYGAGFAVLLGLRLRVIFRGEEQSETAAPRTARRSSRAWSLPLPDPAAAVCEKEFLYVRRSLPLAGYFFGPLLVAGFLALPPATGIGRLAFPAAAAYGLFGMFVYAANCFGMDGGGIRLFLLAPRDFATILRGKNLAAGFCFALALSAAGLLLRLWRPAIAPGPSMVALTVAGIALVLPVGFAAANLLAMHFPRRLDWQAFGRRKSSTLANLILFGVFGPSLAVAAVIGWLAIARHEAEVGATVLALLAIGAWWGYARVLGHADAIARLQREELVSRLCA